jgi:hypothetical protein
MGGRRKGGQARVDRSAFLQTPAPFCNVLTYDEETSLGDFLAKESSFDHAERDAEPDQLPGRSRGKGKARKRHGHLSVG